MRRLGMSCRPPRDSGGRADVLLGSLISVPFAASPLFSCAPLLCSPLSATPFTAASGLASPLLFSPTLHFGSKRDPDDQEYDLCLGKVTDTLRDDYRAFFERGPNFEIYDERVVLEIGDPVCMKPLRGKLLYTKGLDLLRGLVSRIVADGKVECRIHDKLPPEWALKVVWVCSGQIGLGLGPALDFQISANSLYGLARQPADAGQPKMSYKIDRHRIEFTEIVPWELKRHLSKVLPLQACELDMSLAAVPVCV